ncbi:hypothetical protein FOZ62_017187, partial [Perkinsus olseni]
DVSLRDMGRGAEAVLRREPAVTAILNRRAFTPRAQVPPTNDNFEGHYLACIAAFKNQDPVGISAAVAWLNDRGPGKGANLATPVLAQSGLSFLSVHSPHEAMSLLTCGVSLGQTQPGCKWAANWCLDSVGPYYNSLWQPLV